MIYDAFLLSIIKHIKCNGMGMLQSFHPGGNTFRILRFLRIKSPLARKPEECYRFYSARQKKKMICDNSQTNV